MLTASPAELGTRAITIQEDTQKRNDKQTYPVGFLLMRCKSINMINTGEDLRVKSINSN
jgi:hypothetical protein